MELLRLACYEYVSGTFSGLLDNNSFHRLLNPVDQLVIGLDPLRTQQVQICPFVDRPRFHYQLLSYQPFKVLGETWIVQSKAHLDVSPFHRRRLFVQDIEESRDYVQVRFVQMGAHRLLTKLSFLSSKRRFCSSSLESSLSCVCRVSWRKYSQTITPARNPIGGRATTEPRMKATSPKMSASWFLFLTTSGMRESILSVSESALPMPLCSLVFVFILAISPVSSWSLMSCLVLRNM